MSSSVQSSAGVLVLPKIKITRLSPRWTDETSVPTWFVVFGGCCGALLRGAGEDTCPYVSDPAYYCGGVCGGGASEGVACGCITELGISLRGATKGMVGIWVTSPRSASAIMIPA